MVALRALLFIIVVSLPRGSKSSSLSTKSPMAMSLQRKKKTLKIAVHEANVIDLRFHSFGFKRSRWNWWQIWILIVYLRYRIGSVISVKVDQCLILFPTVSRSVGCSCGTVQ